MTITMPSQVTVIDCLSDVLFIGFAVSPEWDLSKTFDPSMIDIQCVTSRHFDQYPSFHKFLDEMHEALRTELVVLHVCDFLHKLNTLMPGSGNYLNPKTLCIVRGVMMPIGILPPTLPTLDLTLVCLKLFLFCQA